MKIGFDARMITHPGIGSYIGSLLSEVIKLANKDKFILFGDPEALKDFKQFKNVRIKEWKAPIYSIREQIFTPYDSTDIDLLHVPHFNIPLFTRKKIITTIHDLIYLIVPRSTSSPLAKFYAHFMAKQSLEKSAKVISVSNNTKNDLINIFGNQHSDKIETIYEAPPKEFCRNTHMETNKKIKEKFNLAERFLLYVGSIKPHKNVATLIRVFHELKIKGLPHELVIAGRWDKKENHLKKLMEKDKGIKYLGEVEDKDLKGLYNAAEVLVHLSLYEGFGLTVLEAMRCGTPVVVSNTSSLKEVAGSAALTVSPLNIDEIAYNIYNILEDSNLRNRLIESGLKQAKLFSWEKTARQTLDLYHSI